MDINPASLPQIMKGRGGRVVFIDTDALDIAKDLLKISLDLRLAYNEVGEYFVVFQIDEAGEEHLVTTANEADARLLERVRKVVSPVYDLAAEAERIDAEADREADRAFSEGVGTIAERLAHAIRKDIGATNRIHVPRSITDDQE